MQVGMAAGLHFARGDHRHRVVIGKDTRLLRLHDRDRADRRLHRRGHGRVPARPDADAGRRHADPLAARRSRRHDLGLAQSVRRQRHQAVRARRLQALRRDRGRDRGADRAETVERAGAPAASIGRAKRDRRRRTTRYIEFAKRTLPRDCASTACGSSIDCANGAAYKVAPEALWELGAEVFADRRRAGRLQHQSRGRLDRARGAGRQGAGAARRYRHRARRRRRPA